jgi:hypothetical protein
MLHRFSPLLLFGLAFLISSPRPIHAQPRSSTPLRPRDLDSDQIEGTSPTEQTKYFTRDHRSLGKSGGRKSAGGKSGGKGTSSDRSKEFSSGGSSKGKGGKSGSGSGSKKGKSGGDDDDVTSEECNGIVRSFTTSVLLNFIGTPSNLDSAEVKALEDIFGVAYNRLGDLLCNDGSFRIVSDATIVLDDESAQQRQLQLIGPIPVLQIPFPLFFQINWQCNACGGGSTLFGNDAGRKLDESVDSTAAVSRNLRTKEDACAPCKLPSPEMFTMVYNDVLQEAINEGVQFDAVTALVSVSELKEVSCSEKIKKDDTTLVIDFLGDPDEASSDEMMLLAESVGSAINALNGLNDETCDPFFRVVLSVDAELVEEEEIILGRRLMPFKFKVLPFKIFFNVFFQCRGCPGGTTLFTNDAARRWLEDTSERRGLQASTTVSDECLCAIGADEFRAPTPAEFDVAFNLTVSSLIEEGAIDFIFQVGSMTEVEEISCAATVDDRESQLVFEAEGDSNDLTSGDLIDIEEAIQAALDKLYSQVCDPQVRTILDVSFGGFLGVQPDDESGGRLLFNSTFISTPSIIVSTPIDLSVDIIFSCRGCPIDAGLFVDDAIASSTNDRMLSHLVPNSQRRLPVNGDQCYCDVTTVDDSRTPTIEEFSVLFAAEIENLNLPIVFNFANITEITPSLPPSSAAPIAPSPTMSPFSPADSGSSTSSKSQKDKKSSSQKGKKSASKSASQSDKKSSSSKSGKKSSGGKAKSKSHQGSASTRSSSSGGKKGKGSGGRG